MGIAKSVTDIESLSAMYNMDPPLAIYEVEWEDTYLRVTMTVIPNFFCI